MAVDSVLDDLGTVGKLRTSAFQRYQDRRKRRRPPKVMNAYCCMLFLCFSNVFEGCTKVHPRGGGGGGGDRVSIPFRPFRRCLEEAAADVEAATNKMNGFQ